MLDWQNFTTIEQVYDGELWYDYVLQYQGPTYRWLKLFRGEIVGESQNYPSLSEAIHDFNKFRGQVKHLPPSMVTRSILHAARTLTSVCHTDALQAGWWTDLETGNPRQKPVAEAIALIHTEISEAFEGYRKNLMDDKLPERSMLEVELADALIRIFDFAGGYSLDVAGAMVEKMEYNRHREDHKLDARRSEGGKKF